MSIDAMKHYEAALKAAFPQGASGEVFEHWNKARLAIEQAEKQEPVAWKNAAMRLGEELSSVGPEGYYDMTAEQWLSWAMDQRPTGKQSLQVEPVAWMADNGTLINACTDPHLFTPLYTAPPQRQPLTEEEMLEILVGIDAETKRLPPGIKAFARAIERAHGIGGGE